MVSDDAASSRRGIGVPATVWTAIQILGNAYGAYRITEIIRDLVDHSDPRWKDDLWWYLPASLVLSLLAVLAAIAVLLRYKVGVFALIGLAAVSIVLGATVGGLTFLTIAPAAGIGVLLLLLKPRWDALR